MIRWIRTAGIGVRAAWETPRWLDGTGLRRLLEVGTVPETGPEPSAPAPGTEDRDAPSPDAERAVRWAGRALRLLARWPGTRWRSTCLYRSVAACLVHHRLGLASRLELGARREDDGDAIRAHAWTGDSAAAGRSLDAWSPFRRARPRSGRVE